MARQSRGWLESLRIYSEPKVVRMLFLGFSAGLPLLLVFGTLSFWLREAGVRLQTIGFMSWVGLIWGFKWTWAPLVDSVRLPVLHRWLGRRRSWLFLAQAGLVATLSCMAMTDPARHLGVMAALAMMTAFFGATQDIALDAFRIESAPAQEQGALAAAYQTGYRLAMIWSGAGALAIAAMGSGTAGWRIAYLAMAGSMSVGLATVLLSSEPAGRQPLQESAGGGFAAWLRRAAIEPFTDFFSRFGLAALLVLSLIATYRISDVVMGVMANPFYNDMGFTKEEVAAVTKVFGVIMTLLGAFLGGVVSVRIGVMRALMAGAVLSSLTNVLFSILALRGHDLGFLVFTVSADNLASGLASAAFIAYLSGLTNVKYSATQYALFSSVMLLLPKFLAGFSGMAVEHFGYSAFFIGTAALGIPVLALVWLASRTRA